jgi:hypothetical protein
MANISQSVAFSVLDDEKLDDEKETKNSKYLSNFLPPIPQSLSPSYSQILPSPSYSQILPPSSYSQILPPPSYSQILPPPSILSLSLPIPPPPPPPVLSKYSLSVLNKSSSGPPPMINLDSNMQKYVNTYEPYEPSNNLISRNNKKKKINVDSGPSIEFCEKVRELLSEKDENNAVTASSFVAKIPNHLLPPGKPRSDRKGIIRSERGIITTWLTSIPGVGHISLPPPSSPDIRFYLISTDNTNNSNYSKPSIAFCNKVITFLQKINTPDKAILVTNFPPTIIKLLPPGKQRDDNRGLIRPVTLTQWLTKVPGVVCIKNNKFYLSK